MHGKKDYKRNGIRSTQTTESICAYYISKSSGTSFPPIAGNLNHSFTKFWGLTLLYKKGPILEKMTILQIETFFRSFRWCHNIRTQK